MQLILQGYDEDWVSATVRVTPSRLGPAGSTISLTFAEVGVATIARYVT